MQPGYPFHPLDLRVFSVLTVLYGGGLSGESPGSAKPNDMNSTFSLKSPPYGLMTMPQQLFGRLTQLHNQDYQLFVCFKFIPTLHHKAIYCTWGSNPVFSAFFGRVNLGSPALLRVILYILHWFLAPTTGFFMFYTFPSGCELDASVAGPRLPILQFCIRDQPVTTIVQKRM